jgi:hypothetical protein
MKSGLDSRSFVPFRGGNVSQFAHLLNSVHPLSFLLPNNIIQKLLQPIVPLRKKLLLP